ncbi:putative endochitinase isoform X2 [Lampetra fluviatilis]
MAAIILHVASAIVACCLVSSSSSSAMRMPMPLGAGSGFRFDSRFCLSRADGLYRDPTDYNAFYQCASSHSYYRYCDPGLVFHEGLSVCVASSPSPNFCLYKSDGMYSDPGDRNSFYHCSNTVAYHKQCPEGLSFSQNAGQCIW